MIAKKSKKNNLKTATNKPYNLKSIKIKKAQKATKKKLKQGKGLNLFLGLTGFVVTTGAFVALIVPTLSHADTITKHGKGTFITEDFSCKVALADYKELQKVLDITPRTDFKYKVFLEEFEAVTTSINNHSDCEIKGVENAK